MISFSQRSIILMLLTCFLFFCSDGANSLSGSISDLEGFNLAFDRVEIKLFDEGLKVSYKREVPNSPEADIVAGVTILREGTAITANQDIDMALYGAVDRFVRTLDETGSYVEDGLSFPGIGSGKINFSQLSNTEGRPIEGKFYVTFTNGYTLNGSFSGDLIVE